MSRWPPKPLLTNDLEALLEAYPHQPLVRAQRYHELDTGVASFMEPHHFPQDYTERMLDQEEVLQLLAPLTSDVAFPWVCAPIAGHTDPFLVRYTTLAEADLTELPRMILDRLMHQLGQHPALSAPLSLLVYTASVYRTHPQDEQAPRRALHPNATVGSTPTVTHPSANPCHESRPHPDPFDCRAPDYRSRDYQQVAIDDAIQRSLSDSIRRPRFARGGIPHLVVPPEKLALLPSAGSLLDSPNSTRKTAKQRREAEAALKAQAPLPPDWLEAELKGNTADQFFAREPGQPVFSAPVSITESNDPATQRPVSYTIQLRVAALLRSPNNPQYGSPE